MEGGRLDAALDRAPHAGDVAVDEQRRQYVTVHPHHRLAHVRRDDPAAVRVGEQDAVPHRHQPRRCRCVLVGAQRARNVEQLLAVRPLESLEIAGEGQQSGPRPGPVDHAELGDVGRRRRPEPLEVAPRQHPHRLLGNVRVGHDRLVAGSDERPPGAERPRAAAGNVEQRGVLPKRPPRPFHRGCPDPLLEPRRTLRDRTRLGEVVDELGNHPVGVVEGQPAGGEPAVVQPSCAQRGFHRLAERPIVADVDGVQGDPNQRGLDHVAGGEGAVEVSGVEVADPVPQGDVRRRWLLGLEGDDAAYRIGHARRLAMQQQLAGEGRPVEAAGGDLGVGHVA